MALSNLVAPHIEQLRAYRPDEPLSTLKRRLDLDEIIKLSSNESLFGPSPRAVEAIGRAAPDVFFYPDGGDSGAMHRAIADFHGIGGDQIITANGSNEVLTLIVRTFCESGVHSAVTFDYGFVIYALICRAHGIEVRTAPMGHDFALDLDALAEAIDETTKVVFIANPNNPTGTHVGAHRLRRFLAELPPRVIAVIDEAYFEYVTDDQYDTALPMRDLHERLVVLRTFSKCYALAGLRAGYGIAPAPMIDRMHRIREPFTTNALAQAAVPPALEDQAFLKSVLDTTEKGRATFEQGLEHLADKGVCWTRSETNFLLVEVPDDARSVADTMLRSGIMVRPMVGYGLDQHLRISIADPPKMKRCVQALAAAVCSHSAEFNHGSSPQ